MYIAYIDSPLCQWSAVSELQTLKRTRESSQFITHLVHTRFVVICANFNMKDLCPLNQKKRQVARIKKTNNKVELLQFVLHRHGKPCKKQTVQCCYCFRIIAQYDVLLKRRIKLTWNAFTEAILSYTWAIDISSFCEACN